MKILDMILLLGIGLTIVCCTVILVVEGAGNDTNSTMNLNCIRTFYSDKGYGEDLATYCNDQLRTQ